MARRTGRLRMSFNRVLVLPVVVAVVLRISCAQTQVEVTKVEAQSHLLKKVEPAYPPFAKAAGVEGIVHVRVGIGLNGQVGALLGSSGPASLFKAAEDAVVCYRYRPFELNGQVAYVRTTVDVPFRMSAHKEIAPPPPLTRQNFWGSDYHRALTELSAPLHQWLSTHLPPDRDGVCDSPAASCASERLTPANEGIFEQVDVFAIPASSRGNHLYLITWREDCGGTGNCLQELVEETPTGVNSILTALGSGYYVYSRRASAYPDIFIASHISAREVGIQGYVDAGGHWGELYCGEIEINDDESERDEVRICN